MPPAAGKGKEKAGAAGAAPAPPARGQTAAKLSSLEQTLQDAHGKLSEVAKDPGGPSSAAALPSADGPGADGSGAPAKPRPASAAPKPKAAAVPKATGKPRPKSAAPFVLPDKSSADYAKEQEVRRARNFPSSWPSPRERLATALRSLCQRAFFFRR